MTESSGPQSRESSVATRSPRRSYVWRLAALKLLDRLTHRRSLWVLKQIVRLKP
ncbi:MAG: hypothetical protein AB7E81_13075 [Hyphomicrobiaceae bacterium]